MTAREITGYVPTLCSTITARQELLVYKGRAARSHYSHQGGGGNYQCVIEEPETFSFGPGTVEAVFIYGAVDHRETK